jgi:hypothetical protein
MGFRLRLPLNGIKLTLLLPLHTQYLFHQINLNLYPSRLPLEQLLEIPLLIPLRLRLTIHLALQCRG